jgi:hypothetical protein
MEPQAQFAGYYVAYEKDFTKPRNWSDSPSGGPNALLFTSD